MPETTPYANWDCTIALSRIHRTGESFEETFSLPLDGPIAHWGQTYAPQGPLTATIRANYAGERIVVKVSVSARFTLPCSRCLADTGLAIAGDLRYLFTLRPVREESEENDGADEDGEIDLIPLDSFQGEVDFAPYIWEALVLHLPEGVLCAETCKGLCPICGKDRNETDCDCEEDRTDPRLAVLRELN